MSQRAERVAWPSRMRAPSVTITPHETGFATSARMRDEPGGRRHELLLGGHGEDLARAGLGGAAQQAIHRGASRLEGSSPRCRIAAGGTGTAQRSRRRRRSPPPAGAACAAGGTAPPSPTSRSMRRPASPRSPGWSPARSASRPAASPPQPAPPPLGSSACVPQSSPVRRSSSNRLGVAMSACGSAWSRRNSSMPGRTIDAVPGIADHRVAAVDGARVRRPHAPDRMQDRLADAGVAHVAGQHGIAAAQHVAGGDAVHQLADTASPVNTWPVQCAVAGVVGELDGVDRPDLGTETLQRENGAGVADMAVGDPGLDREDVHGEDLTTPAA